MRRVGSHVLALSLTWGCLACDESPRVAQTRPEARQRPRAADDRPTGYPEGFPIVEGGRVLEGSVDEGVIRTSSLEYTAPCSAIEASLRQAFGTVGARVIARTELDDGTVSIRASRRSSQVDQEASFSMRTALGRCVLRTIASDSVSDVPEIRQ